MSSPGRKEGGIRTQALLYQALAVLYLALLQQGLVLCLVQLLLLMSTAHESTGTAETALERSM